MIAYQTRLAPILCPRWAFGKAIMVEAPLPGW
jgi:hypothetical protein